MKIGVIIGYKGTKARSHKVAKEWGTNGKFSFTCGHASSYFVTAYNYMRNYARGDK